MREGKNGNLENGEAAKEEGMDDWSDLSFEDLDDEDFDKPANGKNHSGGGKGWFSDERSSPPKQQTDFLLKRETDLNFDLREIDFKAENDHNVSNSVIFDELQNEGPKTGQSLPEKRIKSE